MSEPFRFRHLWKHAPRLGIYTVNWDIIKHDSYVVITLAEAVVSEQVPTKFIGEAKPMVIGNISPHDGSVEFTVWWYGDFPYLDIWTDILVFNSYDSR
jgi:hypothetical protein